ncbi:S8 family peptidase [Pedobacter nutrimenti]|uniref:Subtilase family protein n=1 Tax=Pedobacter nutrimenti TaxID=1241337 RepID=A0A318UDP7_9SPHI|nr:S8 family peptidase [Pedobacter nutrimenti]PYF74514.1 subtilase family protein [Pedobacter nutrimenti]
MKFKSVPILFIFIIASFFAAAQNKNVVLPEHWQHLDVLKDGYFGISADKAYAELLKDKKTSGTKVIVAVIDGGVDINHEDLKGKIWINPKEKPGDGVDNDGNGYIDDVYGWNFIGSSKGNLAYDNLELIRIYKKLSPKYKSTIKSTVLDSTEKEEYKLYNKVTTEFGKKYDDASANFRVLEIINKVLTTVSATKGKDGLKIEDVEAYKADNEEEEQVKKIIRSGAKESGSFDKFYKEIKDAYKQYDVMLRYNLNPAYDQRAELVGDHYDQPEERLYGNNDVKGPNAEHGTHVAGIIAAKRNNGLGMNGIADAVEIMAIRVVPEGDERDKDVANAIRYAADQGARIINMSFGKGFKWDKKIVDEAVKYAEKKGVLFVHAAGNDNLNLDTENNYPNRYFEGIEAVAYQKKQELLAKEKLKEEMELAKTKKSKTVNRSSIKSGVVVDSLKFLLPQAEAWIEVGASSYKDDLELKASFSNYGKYSVDVFAPGFRIKSTIPDSKYEEFDGTSMAAPVVSGMAAVLLTYYPKLRAKELKEIILKSVVKVSHKVKNKNEKGETVKVSFSELCRTGGIVNLYNALKLAAEYPAR